MNFDFCFSPFFWPIGLIVRVRVLLPMGWLRIVGLCAMLELAAAQPAWTQSVAESTDRVVLIREGTTTGETTIRKGLIVDWKGGSLTLSANGRERDFDNDAILEIQTSWPSTYLAGKRLLKSGDLSGAEQNLQAALQAESRPWARRIIRADLVQIFSLRDQPAAAIQQFLAITSEDPQTRFFGACPLPWLVASADLRTVAEPLLTSRDPVEQLIGASWLLAGPQREAATARLDELSRDIDPNLQHLAIAQLWRLRSTNLKALNPRVIRAWEKQIQAMPHPLRPGPWLIIADAQTRLGDHDSAIINMMRVPILYSEQLGLSAAALYQTGTLLQNTGRSEEAKTTFAELQQKFPTSVWGQAVSMSGGVGLR